MNRFQHIFKNYLGIAIASFLFLGSGAIDAIAQKQIMEYDKSSSHFELNAKIMEIDLSNDIIIIAEKTIYLPSTMQNKEKQWQTILVDSQGQLMAIKNLKPLDSVLVEGVTNANGNMEAHKITFISSDKKVEVKEVQNVEIMQPATQIRKKNGTWTN